MAKNFVISYVTKPGVIGKADYEELCHFIYNKICGN